MGSQVSKSKLRVSDFKIKIPEEFQKTWKKYGPIFGNYYQERPKIKDGIIYGSLLLRTNVDVKCDDYDEIKSLGLHLISKGPEIDSFSNRWKWHDRQFHNTTNFYEWLCNYTYESRNWVIFELLKEYFEYKLENNKQLSYFGDGVYELKFNGGHVYSYINWIRYQRSPRVMSRFKTMFKNIGIDPINLDNFNGTRIRFRYQEKTIKKNQCPNQKRNPKKRFWLKKRIVSQQI
jgi:hypothetical protein